MTEERDKYIDLIADGICAAHRRFREAVPFLYTFMDYLRLALPESCEISLTNRKARRLRYVSSDPKLHLHVDEWREPVCKYDGLYIHWYERQISNKHQKAQAATILEKLIKTIGKNGPQMRQKVLATLCEGLKKIMHDTKAWETQQLKGGRIDANTGEFIICQDTGEEQPVLKQAASDLKHSLSPFVGYGFIFFLRYYHMGRLHVQMIGDHSYHSNGTLPSQVYLWKQDINKALKTGFLQIRSKVDTGFLLSVPIHFGGFPWVVCCRIIKRTEDDLWDAYASYRDVIPRIGEVIRLVGQRSVMSAMFRLFDETGAGFAADEEEGVQAVNGAWNKLETVYPVPIPRLVRPVDAEEKNHLLPVGRHFYKVQMTDRTGPFFQSQPYIVSKEGETYGELENSQVFRSFFLDPAIVATGRRTDAERGRRGALIGSTVHAATNAVRSINAADLCSMLSWKTPPEGLDDLRVFTDDPDAARDLVGCLNRAVLGEDTAAALLVFSEMNMTPGYVRSKFLSNSTVSLCQLIDEACTMINSWVSSVGTDEYARIQLEYDVISGPQTEFNGEWVLPAGYLNSDILRGVIAEIFRNSSHYGQVQGVAVIVRCVLRAEDNFTLNCQFTNQMEIELGNEDKKPVEGFLSQIQRVMTGLAGLALDLHSEASSNVWKVDLHLGQLNVEEVSGTSTFISPVWKQKESEQ